MADTPIQAPTDPIDPTSSDTAKANILASSTAKVDALNADELFRFNQSVDNWHINMLSGQPMSEDRRKPPVPPMKWELAPPDKDGYVWPQQGNTPIAAVPDAVFYHGITVAEQRGALTPGVTDIGHLTGNAGVYSAGPNDTQPVGFKITIPTDPPMTLVKHAWGPFGYIYEQMA